MPYDIQGEDVLGELDGALDGELDGELDGDVVGIVRRNPRTGRSTMIRARSGGSRIQLPAKPNWRKRGMGPGVNMPSDDRLIVPLTAQVNGGVFSATVNNIIYVGRPQKPFRGERLLVKVVRTGTSAVGALLGQLFAGSDLQQGALGRFDIEGLGQSTAFDTGINMTPVEPGVEISLDTLITPQPTSTDTVLLSITILGRLMH
jgi:hypothetical protein